MWKKPESENFPSSAPAPPEPAPAPRATPVAPEPRREPAIIGPSISVKGDLAGEEDLLIMGKVEGKVELRQNSITVGKSGRVKADVFGKLITIEGELEGNLNGSEKVILRQSASVRGNIFAPRVSLEDGARFKGTIDMETKSVERPRPVEAEPAGPKPGVAARS